MYVRMYVELRMEIPWSKIFAALALLRESRSMAPFTPPPTVAGELPSATALYSFTVRIKTWHSSYLCSSVVV